MDPLINNEQYLSANKTPSTFETGSNPLKRISPKTNIFLILVEKK